MNARKSGFFESSPGPPQVLASAANGLVDMITRAGGDVDRIFGTVRVNKKVLASPFNELALKQYCELLEEAARQTRCDNFGLRFAGGFHPKRLGALGYIVINSPSLDSGLRNLCDYFPAHQQASMAAIRENRGLLCLDYQVSHGSIDQRRQDAEFSIGVFCNFFRHCHGSRWNPIEIRFEHPRLSEAKEYETMFDAPVIFSSRINSVVFRRNDLEAVMPDPDPYLFSLVERFMHDRRERLHTETLIDLVRRKIEAHLEAGNPQIKKVSSELGLTSWTLHRRLRDINVNFNDLVRDVRRQLALRYLYESHLPLTEVALQLGYSELSAFTRAFKQWTGMGPSRYRRLRIAR